MRLRIVQSKTKNLNEEQAIELEALNKAERRRLEQDGFSRTIVTGVQGQDSEMQKDIEALQKSVAYLKVVET